MSSRWLVVVRCIILLGLLLMLVMTVSAPVARAASIIRVKPMGVGTWPCGSTWATACAFLQTAVTNAASGDEIWVAAGVHKPSYGTDRTITFQLKSNMALYGGFAGTEKLRTKRDPAANVTILSGDIDSNDVNTDGNEVAETTADIVGNNAYHVVTGAAGVILDGLIITAGDADSGSNCPSNGCGGGLYNYANSSTVTDVIFSGNYAAYVGGGMANVSQGFDFPSDAVLSKVTFVGNGSGNTGGGLYNYLNTATLTNVTFKGNSAPYGGAMHNYAYASVAVTNVTFKGNWSYDGRALYNNTVASVTVRNSILWNDGALEIENDSTSHVYISNSVLSGGCPTGFSANTECTNLTTTDPVLGTLANYGGNVPTLPLLPGSSATSATTTNCPATDARGIARTATCDLGAFESRGFVLTKTSGDNQITPISTVFANPLGLTITATGAGEPVDGGRLTFMPPASGASATIVSNPATVAGGVVTATATANGTNGAYTVTVAADPAAPVNFSLKNSSTLYAKPGGLTTGACSSWANACELRYALNSIGAGEIWVAAGTYTPITTTDRTTTFQLKSDVAIYGGFAMTETLQSQRNPAANVVTLSGDIGVIGNNSDNAYHVVTGATGATLDGVTISDGNANVGSMCPGNDCGGGMTNTNANPTLNNVTFRNNFAATGGGLYNHASSPTLTNVTFRDNSAVSGGGLSNYLSSPTLANVTFSGNAATFKGGGLYNNTSSTPT